MLIIQNLCRSFSLGQKKTKKALTNINLSFPDTGLICICGKSGSGKTTLLNLLGLQDKPTSGTVQYCGCNIFAYSERQKNEYRGLVIGRISQDYDLIPELSVWDNCVMAIKLSAQGKQSCSETVLNALNTVGLPGYEDRVVSGLSGGEKQRVGIARALAKNAKVFLCDEPTGNLDPDSAKSVMEILKRVSKHVCVIVVTHNRSLAERFADRIVDLSNGQVVSDRVLSGSTSADGIRLHPDVSKSKKRSESGSFGYLLRFIWLHFRSRIAVSLVALLLLAGWMALLFAASYMSEYSESYSLAATLKEKSLYAVSLTQYTEWLGSDGPYAEYGWRKYDRSTAELFEQKHPEIEFGEAYSFNKSFYDFSENRVFSSGIYETISFSNFIAVSDYGNYHNPLTIGKYPETGQEVLISDYMADRIVSCRVFADVHSPEDLLGYTIREKATDFQMTVSGIYATEYRQFADIGEDAEIFGRDASYYVGNHCLAWYSCVYGRPELVPSIIQNSYSASLEAMQIEYYPGEYIDGQQVQKAYEGTLYWVLTSEMAGEKGIEITYHCGYGYGAMMRDTVLADFLGISVDELMRTADSYVQGQTSNPSPTIEKMIFGDNNPKNFRMKDSTGYALEGVFHTEGDYVPDIIFLEKNEDYQPYLCYSGFYQGPVVLLGDEIGKNAETLVSLYPELHDASAWDNLEKDSPIEGDFCLYSYMDEVVNRPTEYLEVTNKLYEDYSWLLIGLLVLSLFAYLILSVKKNARAVGILRSVGVSRGRVMQIYAGLSLFLTGLSWLEAIPISVWMLSRVNTILSEMCGCQVILYTFRWDAVLVASIWITFSVLIAQFLLIIWLKIKNPVNLINRHSD